MKEYQFSVKINAPKEKVWSIMWNDNTFREWANYIDKGMYMVGEMKEGNNVHFVSPINNYGVISKIEKLIPNEYIIFKHQVDTIGNIKRDNEWSGGTESYELYFENGITTLINKTELPIEQIETFNTFVPLALNCIKELAEMTYILLSADNYPSVYLAPQKLVDNFHKYVNRFDEWLVKSPNASDLRTIEGHCFDESDFVRYLNTEVFIETPLVFFEKIESLDKYENCFNFNF